MIRPRVLVLCLLAPLGFGAAAHAQNLLGNSEFDAGLGLSGWATTAGSWGLGADAGTCPLSDSASGLSAPQSDQFLAMISEQCLPVDPVATPTLHLGGLYQTTGSVYVGLYLTFYSDGACTNLLAFSPLVLAFQSATWSSLLGPVAVEASAGSMKAVAQFSAINSEVPQFTGSFDRLYLGVLPELFVGDFEAESGSACRWSSVVGGG